MNTFIIEEFFVNDTNVCNFYTVRHDDHNVSETDKFYDEFFVEGHEHENDIRIIDALIVELSIHGTKIIRRIRDEARASALPPEVVTRECTIEVIGNKLRLYYVEVSENVIILLGGAIAHDGTRPPFQFNEAQTFSKKITEANNNFFEVRNNKIISTDGEEIIIN